MKTIDIYDFLADIGREPYKKEEQEIRRLFWAYVNTFKGASRYFAWRFLNT